MFPTVIKDETLTDPSGEAFGLVPDGVVAITAKFSNGTERDVAVADNYWQFSWNGAEGHRRGTSEEITPAEWLTRQRDE